ncbi:MAG: DUF4438 domain-containing protein [Candidatus Eremiobacteraeota bacterium]|nr:DUF4438 domain-containing protein [Candidatus Eremiobacteraeota bacterium]
METRINRSELVMVAVAAEATQPAIPANLYHIGFDGNAVVVPGVGGITPNVRVGDPAFAFAADHIEPGVSVRHSDESRNASFNVFSCIGNEAIVISGDAKGETGIVTGKHGGVEHVLIDFPAKVMKRMAVGDRIQVWGQGVGLKLLDAPEVAAFNMDPDFPKKWGLSVRDGRVHAKVTRIVPAAIMGSGIGRPTVVRGDYDIQTFDDEIAAKYGLRDIRLGDIVAISDADNTFGRIYKTGALTVGIVVHGASMVSGHGPGVTTLLTSSTGAIETTIDSAANIADILNLR